MYIKPKGGATLRHPDTGALVPPYGAGFPDDYATRRLLDGDAEETTAAAIEKARKASTIPPTDTTAGGNAVAADNPPRSRGKTKSN